MMQGTQQPTDRRKYHNVLSAPGYGINHLGRERGAGRRVGTPAAVHLHIAATGIASPLALPPTRRNP